MVNSLAADLRRLIGEGKVSTEQEHIERYSGDALGTFRAFRAAERLSARPVAVVWPADTQDVSRLLRFAGSQRIPVVPYAAGTGVMGAAASVEGCIVLNLTRMCSVLEVSREDRCVRAQAGAILEDVSTALEREGMLLGHDPWSRPIATVGGAISTDGVGYLAAGYGSMGQQVLGLEVVLPTGEVVRTRAVPNTSLGPSLNHLFIGSEGTLGVITEATVQAFPQPEQRLLRAFVFPEFEAGYRAVTDLFAQGLRPALLDYGDEYWPEDGQESREATLYLAFDGLREDVEARHRRASEVCRRFGARDAEEGEAQQYWNTRHASAERYKREVLQDPKAARRRRSGWRMDYLHVSLPASRVLEYRRRCQEFLASRRIAVHEWSLWARPEFFSFLIGAEDDTPDAAGRMAEAVDTVLVLAQDMGGSMEYCHGVGIKLAHLYGRELGAGVQVVRDIKRALDPNNILNPGKLAG